MKHETRTGEVRAAAEDGTIEILAVAHGVTDDYGTQFQRGTFTESLEERLPVIAWAHDWSEPVGRATGYRETDEGLYLTARLDIGAGIPRADQAHTQLRSGTLTDVSVGFMRRADEEREGVTVITKADLDEVSFVLRGAVPGAKVLAVRSARAAGLDFEDAVQIAKRKASGELTEEEAEALISLLSSDDGAGTEVLGGGEGSAPQGAAPPPEAPDPAAEAVIAEAEEIIDSIDGRSR